MIDYRNIAAVLREDIAKALAKLREQDAEIARLRLTNEERRAITWASAGMLHDADKTWPAFRERSKHSRDAAETLKGLLERHKND